MPRRFRPAQLRLLFIGEAPPASGRFFYHGDSGLYRAFRDAFRLIDPSMTDARFLPAFQAAGCYLIDLCPKPVDQLDPRARRIACRESEAGLSQRIRRLQPPVIAILVKSIRANVERAAAGAGWNGRFIDLPYPGRWVQHREVFLETIVPELRALHAVR
jgi:hypothetical protein